MAAISSSTAPAHVTLRSPRLILRPLRVEDADDLHPVFSDPDSMRYWSHLPHKDMDDTRAALTRICDQDDGASRAWAVTTDGDRCLGWTSLFGAEGGLVWIGYILCPHARGQGFATEAVQAAIDYAFGPWRMHRIEANIDPRNQRSARLLERLGFIREGHRREDFFLGDQYHDTLIFGLLAAEWRHRKAAADRLARSA